MKKFSIIVSLVFVLAICAEWIILSNPTSGVVLFMNPEHKLNTWRLHVITNQGNFMDVELPPTVWQEWLQHKTAQR